MKGRGASLGSESDLYYPVKAFLEAQGYIVKGEVLHCDLVACRGEEPPVIVELKLRFNLALLLQGVRRLSLSERVYLAVPRVVGARRQAVSPEDRDVRRLCRMLGLGLLTVNPAAPAERSVEVVVEPEPYRPRKNKALATKLLREHGRRGGDPNLGGINRRPIVTAYRQEALRCAQLLAGGPRSLAELRATGMVPNAARILQSDVYGWFARQSRGRYALSEAGQAALTVFSDVLELDEPGGAVAGLAS